MPLYEYQCSGCGEQFEALQRIGEGGESLTCPICGHPKPQKVFSTFAAGSVSPGASPAPASCGSGGFG